MNMLEQASVPVLTCEEAGQLERMLLGKDEVREWAAMSAAGAAIASAVIADAQEIGGLPTNARVLVLAGKGHNGGDALIAAKCLLDHLPAAQAEVHFVFGERALRPLAARAWRELQHRGRDRVMAASTAVPGGSWDVCMDGVFGFQFRPPADRRVLALLDAVNALEVRVRAAVDLPSADRFVADFTYATGTAKQPLLESAVAGRIRYLDLGFFAGAIKAPVGSDRILTSRALASMQALRPARSDKRTFGHVFVVGGSRGTPGAVLMTVLATLRSGAGLVTAFVPETLVPAFAARAPEAMWVGWPETPSGALALEGEHLLRERLSRADALVIGPGLGREPETLALAASVVRASSMPVVIDADALQPDIVRAGQACRILTPHAGEFTRIAGQADPAAFAQETDVTLVLKGPVTRLTRGEIVYHALGGGPVLARGGSGDLLAGMVGTQVAQTPDDPLAAAARAAVWHGSAAEALARDRGQVGVTTNELLDYLAQSLRVA